MDTGLQVPHVRRSSLQLVGLVALFLASKIEEIYPPQVKDFAAASAGTYTVSEVLSLEGDMIRVRIVPLAVPLAE